MTPEEQDKLFNDPAYEYGEPGEFTKDIEQDVKEHSIINTITLNNDVIGNNALKVDNKDNIAVVGDKRKSNPRLWVKGKSGNPNGRPKTEKRTISSLIDAKLSKEKEAIRFTDHLFELYYAENNKQALSAGIEILNRHEGKVKDTLQITPLMDTIPDQEESLKIANKFKIATAIVNQ